MNWIAFAAAVIAQILLGYLWFHPSVMGNMWAKANNSTIEEMKPKNPAMVYGLTNLFTLLFTVFMWLNVTGFGQEDIKFHTFQHGIAHGVLLSLLVFIPVIGTPALYTGKSSSWIIVQVGYWLLRAAIAGGILSMWR